ncbi:hypothetical protein LUPINE_94 [Microbacterium phage Lupine]|nr:hypothetical protein LUPINE_94 [Microbacterium phage Lupine]
MSDQREELAQALAYIDEDIQDAKDAMQNADSARMYHRALEVKVDLLRDRQAVVEQLEALGLEDPAS